MGGTPYIAYKTNANPKGDGMYAKLFHLYRFKRDEFLMHYHKRSNVETTNSMIKATFGDHVRSKTDIAMANEALGKVLCHNICCLIQSIFELSSNPTFWGEDQDEAEVEAAPVFEDDETLALTWV